ncbi:WD40 repeat-like protein [Sparassis crispa]|uniref:WD40 repeat-like protein n=1 Tax=Sparassis crispa TaxID=139825 RepID=A0A401GB62_9APHY|nr:WD40 repeat-like protein [Sparassis crispa]GBE79373.1 WD40 repeat-like protein [Sparassis crispa]
MALLDAPGLTNVAAPIRSTSLPAGAYVLSIISLPSSYAVSASAPNNAIHLFNKSHLHHFQTLPGHQDAITDLKSVIHFAGATSPILISCGKDGVVKAWDDRTQSAALQMSTSSSGRHRPLLSCDVSSDGFLVAAGTDFQGEDASILYWDPRNAAAPLRVHSSTHSDDITALHFLHTSSFTPHSSRTLLSASSDGLVCTSNADEEDEDEAGLHVGNWGCSVARVGWVHRQSGSPGIWASSDMETFSIWSSELDLVRDVDIRQPSIHRQDLTWVTDYLIGCHNHHHIPADEDNDLSIFVGSNEGDIASISRSSFSDPNAPWLLTNTWSTGHTGVVRSVLWDERNNVLLTGGEDSRLNVWSSPAVPLSASRGQPAKLKRKSEDNAMDVDADEDVALLKKTRS